MAGLWRSRQHIHYLLIYFYVIRCFSIFAFGARRDLGGLTLHAVGHDPGSSASLYPLLVSYLASFRPWHARMR